MRAIARVVIAITLAAGTLHAGERTSANYMIVAESIDAGGARTSSANYGTDGSLGGVAGFSTAASPGNEVAKQGYLGQLYEIAGLRLLADPETVGEGATRQITAEALLDDATTLSSSPGGVLWSVVTGPVAGLDTNGLATAGLVYEDTLGTLQGSSAGFDATIDLTVLDTDPDNFGTYAGDGIDDDWQVAYFGLDNPDAAPGSDPDGDEQDNGFEFLAKVNPTDPFSHFTVCLQPTPGQPGKRDILFSPVFGDRDYTVMVGSDLAPGNVIPLAGGTITDAGAERKVTDNAAPPRRFYRIDITRP